MRSALFVVLCAATAQAQVDPVEVARILAPTPTSITYFGHAVALDGDTLAVSSEGSAGGVPPGQVFVYVRVAGTWTWQQTLMPVGAVEFGSSLALVGDRLVVGDREFSSVAGHVGAAWVFERTGGVWQQVALLRASDEALGAKFGTSTAIDGDWIAVGAPRDALSASPPGNAYLFHWDGSTWTELARISASDAANSNRFGVALSLSGDKLVVGASYFANQLGKAYVFERSGLAWSQTFQLAPAGLVAPSEAGCAVLVRGDRIFVGAQRDATFGAEIGSVTVFDRQGVAWTQTVSFGPSDAAQLFTPRFGARLAYDGVHLAVGAPVDYSFGGPAAGSIYLFEEIGGAWTQTSKVYTRDRSLFDWYGDAIAIQGNTLAAGVRGDSPLGDGMRRGSARVFDLAGATGQAYCLGTMAQCPCALPGDLGNGCRNSFETYGAGLWAHGAASVANDTLELRAGGLPPATTLVFVQGTLRENAGLGSAFGDGLLCIAGTLVRLKTLPGSFGIGVYPGPGDPPVSVRGGLPLVGGTYTYQATYRNPANFCTMDTFNTTNAVEIAWSP
jgi:hypothetical protein